MRTRALSIVLGVLVCARALVAQDSTRGVRIGLEYNPGSKPGIVVLSVPGPGGDSIRAILERDFDYSDRLLVINAAGIEDVTTSAGPAGRTLNYALFKTMGAAAVLQITPTASGRVLHVALHDVARSDVLNVHDFALPAGELSREWRRALHGIADTVEQWITGQKGISQSRIAFVRGNVVRIIDFDGFGEQDIPVVGQAFSSAWSADGTRIAYSTIGLDSKVVVHDLRSGRTREFGPQRNAGYVTPAFTPDGKSLVYALSGENGTDLYQVPLQGEAFPRRITIGRGSINVGPSFSPEGSRIVFQSDRTGTPQVYIMDADGTNAAIFTAFDYGDQNDRAAPDWAPDGRQIAFHSLIDGRFQIMTMSLRDPQPKQQTSEGVNEDPSWAPDSRHLVFSSTRSGVQQLWILDTESTRLRQLTQVGGSRLPAWSPRLTDR